MAITGEYNLYQQNPYNFGSLTAQGGVKAPRSESYHQANAGFNQGVPNTTPQIMGIPTTADMEMAEKIATGGINNPFALGATSKVGALNQNEMAYVTRPQNESRELENSDISGSHLGAKLDLQGCENKAWGKDLEWV